MKKNLIIAISLIVLLIGYQNCGKNGFSSGSQISFSQTPDLPDITALVYGGDLEDREFLRKKIEGYAPPSLDQILNNWRRISGGEIYNSVNDIDHEALDTSQYGCVTTIVPETGMWAKNAGNISPSMDGYCANQPWFAALSWDYQNGRLRHATNSGNFNGFISNIKLDKYTHEATLTSLNKDDDFISVIIAAKVDEEGNIHTLNAVRTQSTEKNWYIWYKKNNNQVKVLGAKAVGTYNRNNNTSTGVPGTGDTLGWSERKTLVKIERNKNIIKAYASDWGAKGSNDNDLVVSSASEILIDLDDPTFGLQIFQGEQHYGYGIQSQAQSQIYNVKFSAMNDDRYVYDLLNDQVYEKNNIGGYTLRPELRAFDMLGMPRNVGNPETQKIYYLSKNRTYYLVE